MLSDHRSSGTVDTLDVHVAHPILEAELGSLTAKMASIETPVSRRLNSVKNIIVVISGKGKSGEKLESGGLSLMS